MVLLNTPAHTPAPAPPPPYSRFCPGAAGCTSKLHSPTEPLRLVYTLSNATLAPRAQYRWSSADVDLPAAAAATTKQSLILQPFTAAEQPVFADGSTVHLNISVTAGEGAGGWVGFVARVAGGAAGKAGREQLDLALRTSVTCSGSADCSAATCLPALQTARPPAPPSLCPSPAAPPAQPRAARASPSPPPPAPQTPRSWLRLPALLRMRRGPMTSACSRSAARWSGTPAARPRPASPLPRACCPPAPTPSSAALRVGS